MEQGYHIQSSYHPWRYEGLKPDFNRISTKNHASQYPLKRCEPNYGSLMNLYHVSEYSFKLRIDLTNV